MCQTCQLRVVIHAAGRKRRQAERTVSASHQQANDSLIASASLLGESTNVLIASNLEAGGNSVIFLRFASFENKMSQCQNTYAVWPYFTLHYYLYTGLMMSSALLDNVLTDRQTNAKEQYNLRQKQ